MASEEQHLAQFEHNLGVAEHLAESRIYDSSVTALFYAGLHLVTAYLVRLGNEPQTHVQREQMMLSMPELTAVLGAYRSLRDHSEFARYDCGNFTDNQFETIRAGAFATMTTHVQSLLGR